MKTLVLNEDQYLCLTFLLNDEIHRNNSDIEKSKDTDFIALLKEENAIIKGILEELEN